MAVNRKDELDEGRILESLQDIVTRIKTEEDPFLLNVYRRLFRKSVPLTLRSYFAAYFVKMLAEGHLPSISSQRGERHGRRDRAAFSDRGDRGDRSDRNDRNDRNARGERNERGDRSDRNERNDRGDRNSRGRNDGAKTAGDSPSSRQDQRKSGDKRARGEERAARDERPAREERAERTEKSEPRNVLPDDVSTTLFVGIGRNRRVFPRDIIGLILQTTGIDRDHVGDIRVLDNYSFVQVITEDAETVIAALNDMEYRGRKLVVSHSRKREDGPARRDFDGVSGANDEAGYATGAMDGTGAEDAIGADEYSGSSDEPTEFDDDSRSDSFASDDDADSFGSEDDSDGDSGYGEPDSDDDEEDKGDV